MNNEDCIRLANEMAEQARKRLEHRMAVDIYSDGVCAEPDCPWHPDEEPEIECCPHCGHRMS